MPLTYQEKETIVNQVSKVAADSIAAVAAEYRGLSVTALTDLRKQARESDVHLQVVKNTLARRAIKDTDFECMSDGLTGPLLLAFSKEDPGAPARLFHDFAKEHEALQVTALALGGKLLAANELATVAKLPTYDQAVSQLMSVMIGPVSKLARTLNEVVAQVVRVTAAVGASKEEA